MSQFDTDAAFPAHASIAVLALDFQHLPDHARAEVRAKHSLKYLRPEGADID